MEKIIIAALLLTACTTKVEQKPVETVYTDSWPSADMREASLNAINKYGTALLAFEPKDKADFCMGADKVAFYNKLIASIAKYESEYNPSLTYKENFDEDMNKCAVTKKPCVISTGLTQTSQLSCRGYGVTNATTEGLKGIDQNLECTVRILNKLIPKYGSIADAGKYWSTMKPTGKLAVIKEMMCK